MAKAKRNAVRLVQEARLEPALGTMSWAGSALPMTTALASVLRGVIEPALRGLPRTWPFSDRVLVWLLPNLRTDAAAFHSNHGPGMNRIFQDFQLETIDRSLVKRLAARAETLAPGLVLELRNRVQLASKRKPKARR